MSRTRYNIHRDFRLAKLFTPVVNRFTVPLMNAVIALVPKFVRLRRQIRTERLSVPTFDGKSIRAYMFTPRSEAKKAASPNAEGEKLPCLVYFHGGGFMAKGVFSHYTNTRKYAHLARCKVLFVDYRLAPKHPYPIPDNDCYSAYKWVSENAERLGILKSSIAVGGDSAGGSLACSTALATHKNGDVPPCFLLLIYPVISSDMSTESMRRYTDTPMWNAKLNRKMWEMYLNGAEFRSAFDPKAATPAYIETAEFDCLGDEARAFYDFLVSCGCPAELNETKGTLHGYDFIQSSAITKDSINRRVEALNNAFYKKP